VAVGCSARVDEVKGGRRLHICFASSKASVPISFRFGHIAFDVCNMDGEVIWPNLRSGAVGDRVAAVPWRPLAGDL
jgi:hypothetical protein